MTDDPPEPRPLVDPDALASAARAGAADRARREEFAEPTPPGHPAPVDQYGRPKGWYRNVFSWTTYAYLFFAVFFIVGLELIGRHPVVAAILLVWAGANLAYGIAALKRRRTARRRTAEWIERVERGRRGLN